MILAAESSAIWNGVAASVITAAKLSAGPPMNDPNSEQFRPPRA